MELKKHNHLLIIVASLFCVFAVFQLFEYTVNAPSQSRYRAPKFYALTKDYSGDTFFEGFNFEDAPDPTHGFTQYQNERHAMMLNLTRVDNGIAYIRADASNDAPRGRLSVRIATKQTYTRGLFVLDLLHMPTGCGTWPAFWTTSPSYWPSKGEIDIIEGVNLERDNAMTLHTGGNCRMSKHRTMTGHAESYDCDVNSPTQWSNQGCGVKKKDFYGEALNKRGGGIIAMEWTSTLIRMWMFDRNAIPEDLSGPRPSPEEWGVPDALFDDTQCDIAKIFRDHVVIINLTFCGDWAGNTYATSTCPGTSCNAFVRSQPESFRDAYWAIRSLKIYQAAR